MGILLAFGVDAAWEWSQDRGQEREYLEAIGSELEQGLALWPGSVEAGNRALHSHVALLSQFQGETLPPADSLMYWLAGLSRPLLFDSPRAVLDDVLSSGSTQVIRSDGLRLSTGTYRRLLARTELITAQAWATWEQRVQPYLEGPVPRVERLRRGPYSLSVEIPFAASRFEPDFEALFRDPAFESMIAERWIRINTWRVILDQVEAEMVGIVDLIAEELGSGS